VYMLDQLGTILLDDSYAALLIAGDIYDRVHPVPGGDGPFRRLPGKAVRPPRRASAASTREARTRR
jgi:hypothetical protein